MTFKSATGCWFPSQPRPFSWTPNASPTSHCGCVTAISKATVQNWGPDLIHINHSPSINLPSPHTCSSLHYPHLSKWRLHPNCCLGKEHVIFCDTSLTYVRSLGKFCYSSYTDLLTFSLTHQISCLRAFARTVPLAWYTWSWENCLAVCSTSFSLYSNILMRPP